MTNLIDGSSSHWANSVAYPQTATIPPICDLFFEELRNSPLLTVPCGLNALLLIKFDLIHSRRNGIAADSAFADVQIAEQKKAQIPGSVTEIAPCNKFWPAEEYHQQYLEKGGRMGRGQSAAKQCSDPIRCYG